MKLIYLGLLGICIFISGSDGANILFLTPMGSHSHKIFFMGIVNALAERGHNVTIVSAFRNSRPIKNVVDIAIPELDVMGVLSHIFDDGAVFELNKNLILHSPRLCNEGLALKQVQDLKKEKYDIILLSMFYDFCYLSFVHHFKVPFIFTASLGMYGAQPDIIGSVTFPSIVANKLLNAAFPLTFSQRLQSMALNALYSISQPYYMYPKSEEICRAKGLCPPDMPSFNEFNQNASFAILNSVRSLDYPPRPEMPNVIHAGGAHLRPGRPLTTELESWVQGAGDAGFIFFSLGSAVKPTNLPEKYRQMLVKVFGSLKQRVLWKWDEETMVDLPPNVKLEKWLPQQDILAHKNLRLFITHGGLSSTMEATYNGIPVLGMPIFADQFSNMQEAASEGWARVLFWKDFTEQSLKNMIDEILSNKRLMVESRKRSAIMKDVLIHPADEAAFWVEFTLRHGGAHHLKSPLFQISWYEFHNLDVWCTIALIIFLVFYINYIIIKTLLKLCFSSGNKNIKDKKRRKKE